MKSSHLVLNDLLVNLFQDILVIEEKALRNQGSDLTITEMHTIHAISTDRARNMGEIAKDLQITMGTLTTAVDKLIKKGYALRNRSEEDKRVVLVELTDKGMEAIKIHDAFHQDMIDSVIKELSDSEEEVLIDSLNKLMGFFDRKYR